MPKLPPSLKWLMIRRGRIDGEIQRLERYLHRHERIFKRFQALTDELADLKKTLASIDRTLSLHEIQIDPQLIPTICSHRNRIKLPHGELTKLIYRCIALGDGNPVCSLKIVEFIKEQYPDLEKQTLSDLGRKVKYRLNSLQAKGKVVRHHLCKTRDYGWWSFPASSLDIRSPNDDLANSL